jgi:hypothetical protein
MRRVFRWQHERRFRQIEFGGDSLHLLRRQALGIEDNAERIACELRCGEDVNSDEVQAHEIFRFFIALQNLSPGAHLRDPSAGNDA